jgi:hypothetical protein
MKHANDASMAEFLQEKGEFFGRSLSADWLAPESVKLSYGILRIRSIRQYWSDNKTRRSTRPPHGLLDSFIALADDSSEKLTLSSLLRPRVNRSDERISRFAARYGGLQIFFKLTGGAGLLQTEHIEYCAVWRYFARVMRAMLRIAADLHQGRSGPKEEWYVITQVPQVMRQTAHKSLPSLLHPFPVGDEQNWLALTHFVAKDSQQNRAMFGHLVNTLLGLGCVRPWMTWRAEGRPKITYSSRSLLSQLALQLCLRLAKIDAFLVCIHCQKPYSPVVRAPKAGQRNFCPDCRRDGVPRTYALKDFRLRQRQSQLGKEKKNCSLKTS